MSKVHEYPYYDKDGETQYEHVDIFYPKSFVEAPPVFPISDECPEELTAHLIGAFSLLWADRVAAANRIRSAAEALLTQKGITKTALAKGRRSRISLHSRIETSDNNIQMPAPHYWQLSGWAMKAVMKALES
jgi:hypothetical protein